MISGMFYRFALILALAVTCVASGAQSSAVSLQPDLRIIRHNGRVDAAGFDVEFGAQYHAVREVVRKVRVGVIRISLHGSRLYSARKGTQTDEAQLAIHVIGRECDQRARIQPTAREEFMPRTRAALRGLPDLLAGSLREGSHFAALDRGAAQLRAAIAKIAQPLRDQIVRTDAYLKVPFGGSYSRRDGACGNWRRRSTR